MRHIKRTKIVAVLAGIALLTMGVGIGMSGSQGAGCPSKPKGSDCPAWVVVGARYQWSRGFMLSLRDDRNFPPSMSIRNPVGSPQVAKQCELTLSEGTDVVKKFPGLKASFMADDPAEGPSLLIEYGNPHAEWAENDVLKEVVAILRGKHPHLHILEGNLRYITRH